MTVEKAMLKSICSDLLVPDDELYNNRLMDACKRGITYGRKHDEPGIEHKRRVNLCRSIIRHFKCSPEEAAMVLDLTKKDRKQVLKSLEAQIRQKPIIKKQ